MSWNEGIDTNSPTYEFITATDEAIRSVAGPGTGKSFAIKRRIAKLISEGNDPEKILAVTFTRTAAADLKNEISSLSISGSDKVTAKTLHSLCMQFLFREDILSELSRKPRIMFSHEIKTMLHDINKHSYGNLRDKEDKVRAYESAWARLQHEEPGFSKTEIDSKFEEELLAWMKFHNCLLIGEIIPFTLNYLQDNPHSALNNLFDIILIDEYQDLNKAEQELLFELSDLSKVVIVGDDDQSIYSFKFAHPEGIREIAFRYTSCRIINFTVCRRCPQKVVELANNLIHNNSDRTLDTLLPYEENDDGIIDIIQWNTLDNEIFGIAEIVEKEINSGINPEDILILTPRRLIGYELRDIINSKGIKAKSYFRENSLPSDIVRYAFSILYYIAYPNDDVVLRYLLGYKSQTKLNNQYTIIREYSEKTNIPVHEVFNKLNLDEIKIKRISSIHKRYNEIQDEVNELKEYIRKNYENIIDYFIKNENDEIYFEELSSIVEDTINEFDELKFETEDEFWSWYKEVIDSISIQISMPEVPTDIDHVRIMSLHSSKGLSSKIVIITTAIQQLLNYIPEDLDEIEKDRLREEQRRLFYVALTRCKCEPDVFPGKLIISSCVSISGRDALQMNIPSRVDQLRTVRATQFIKELGRTAPRTIKGERYINNN